MNYSKSSGNSFNSSTKFSRLIISSVVNSLERTEEHLGSPVKKLNSPKLSPYRNVIKGVYSLKKQKDCSNSGYSRIFFSPFYDSIFLVIFLLVYDVPLDVSMKN